MTIGKKIRGGFLAVLVLTLFLGYWAISAMREGADVAETIASDRVPRLTCWTYMQNELLESAYSALDFFSTGEEDAIKKAYDYLNAFGTSLKKLKKINESTYYEETDTALKNLEKELALYEQMTRDDQELYGKSEDRFSAMLASAGEALDGFRSLGESISARLQSQLEAGNARAASQLAPALGNVNGICAKISDIFEELLVAERNNDMDAYAEIQAKLPQILAEAEAMRDTLKSDESLKLLEDAIGRYRQFAASATTVAKTLSEFLQRGKKRFEYFAGMYKETVKMAAFSTATTDEYVHKAADDLFLSTKVVGVFLVVALVIGLLVALLITHLIVKPLTATTQFAQEVASGNLDRSLDVQASDETGILANALRGMVSSLKQHISEATRQSEQAQKATAEAQSATARAEEAAARAESARREGMLSAASQLEGMVEVISSASTQLSTQIEQSDRGASESAQRLQEAATAMNEMNATVREVAHNAGSASQASADTRKKALNGQRVVDEVVKSIGEVQETSQQLKADMVQLNERAQDINRIMGVISDIADQTNLLALNAAIEAARAGEAGRGFAVVADEVRKLAEKTMTSTQDVSNAITAIQESTDKSMREVDNAVGKISDATELARQSGASLEEIVSTAETTSDQVRAIAAASEEQSAASDEITRSITEVNTMSRQSAEAMTEAAKAVADLAAQAHDLTDLINKMKKA